MKKTILLTIFGIACAMALAQQNTPNSKWMTPDGTVNAMIKDGNNVYLGGSFNGAGYSARGIAKFSPPQNAVPYSNIPGLSASAVYAIVSDGGTGWYIGGAFTANMNGTNYYNLAHLKSDFTLDTTFQCTANSTVYSLNLKGNILYAGGYFTSVNNQARNYITAVNKTTGVLQPWDPGTDGRVTGIQHKDSLIIITGEFTRAGGQMENGFAVISETSALPKRNYENLNSWGYDLLVKGNIAYIGGAFTQTGDNTGTLVKFTGTSQNRDFNFPATNGSVHCVVPDASGGWYIGGSFSNIENTGINYCAHILPNGAVDPNFTPQPNTGVYALHLHNGKLFMGGSFSYLNNYTSYRTHLAAVDPSTGIVTGWDPGSDHYVYSITSKDSLIFASGLFSNIGGKYSQGLACLSENTGLLKTSFGLSLNGSSYTLLADGNHLYVGGSFNGVGIYSQGLAKTTTASDVPDKTYPTTNGYINCIEPDGSGGYYIGGSFTAVAGIPRAYAAHILSGGTLDSTFNPNVNGSVNAIAVGAGGVFLGGSFNYADNTYTGNFVKVNSSGSLVSSFVTKTYGPVYTICLKGTSVYAGGYFTLVDTNGTNVARNYAFAVNATTGKLLNWNPNAGYLVNKIITNAAGTKCYLGGSFSTINGTTRLYAACVNSGSGTLLTWNPAPDNAVQDLLADGNLIYLAGYFGNVNGIPRAYLAAVDSTNSASLTSLNANITDAYVSSLALNGTNLYIGGGFTNINGTTRNYAAAVNKISGALQSWDPNPNSTVLALKSVSTDVLLGGYFSHSKYQARPYACRINISSIAADTWNPAPDAPVSAMEKLGSKIFLGGDFSNVQSTPRTGLCAIDSASGNLLGFDAGLNGFVYSLKIAGGTIFTQGSYTTATNGDSARNYAAAFSTSTGAPTNWNPNLNTNTGFLSCFGYDNSNLIMGGGFTILNSKNRGYFAAMDIGTGKINNLAMDCDSWISGITSNGNKIYVAGLFTTVNSIARNHVFAIDETSSALTAFNPDSSVTGGQIDQAMQIGNNVYLGGLFTNYASSNLVSVDTLGNTLTGWLPKPNGRVYRLAGDTTRIIPVGDFTYFDYRNHPNLLALDDGTGQVNEGFNAKTNGMVNGLSILGNNIYAGGSFTTANDTNRSYLAAFNKTSGALHTWAPVANGQVNKIKNDGTTLYAVGSFTQIGASNRGCGASFNTAGSLGTWNPQANGAIYDLWLNGTNIYLGGTFTMLKTSSRQFAGSISATNTVQSFNPSPNSYVNAITGYAGHLYLGGSFSQISSNSRSGLASYNLSNHALRAWNPSPAGNNYVYSLELAGHKLYAGGQFNDTIGGSSIFDIVTALDTSTGLATDFHPIKNANIYGNNAYAVLPTCTDILVGGYLYNQNWNNYFAGYDNRMTLGTATTQPTCTYSLNGGVSLSVTNGYTPYTSYTWSNGASTANISGLGVGTYSATVTDALGCTATKSVIVTNQYPDPVASITPGGTVAFCSGSSATLTSSTGIVYSWSTGASTQSISVNAAGSYTVTVTGTGGCTKASAPKSVTVYSLPSATITPTGPVTFCSGTNPLTLTANSGAGLTYKWKKGSTTLSGATAISYIPNSSGTYKVKVTNAKGCSKTSSGIVVTVNALPASTITPQSATTFCAGDSVELLANSGSGFTYQWKKNSANISGATLISYKAKTAGTYKVVVTKTNGCSKTSNGTLITVNCRSGMEGDDTEVFPNPTDGKVTLRFTSSGNQAGYIIITDVTGREVMVEQVTLNEGQNEFHANLAMLVNGVYLLRMKTSDHEIFEKIIKE